LRHDAAHDVAVRDHADQAVGSVRDRDFAAIRLKHEVGDVVKSGLPGATLGRGRHDFSSKLRHAAVRCNSSTTSSVFSDWTWDAFYLFNMRMQNADAHAD